MKPAIILVACVCVVSALAAEPPPTYSFADLAWNMPVAQARGTLERAGYLSSRLSPSKLMRDSDGRAYSAELWLDDAGNLTGVSVEISFLDRSPAETIAERRAIVEDLGRTYGRPAEQDDAQNSVGEVLWPRARDGSLFEVSWNDETQLRLLYRTGRPGFE